MLRKNTFELVGTVLKQAIENHEKHLSIAKEVGDRAGEGEAFKNLGNAFHILGNFEQATEYYEKYLGIAKEVGDMAGEGSAYGSLGIAYHTLGNFQQAIEYFKQQLSITKEVGDRVAEGTGYGNLANAYQSLGNFRRAIEYSNQHLSIAKEVGDRAGEGNAYGNLGNAYGCLGNFSEAIEYHEHRLSVCKEIGDHIEKGLAFYGLGHDQELLGSLSDALSYYHLSIKHLDEARHNLKSEDEWKICFRDSHRVSYTALWRTLLKSGEIEEALYAAEKGRAQALVDILREQYGIYSQSFCPLTPKQTPSAALELLPSQAVFVALDNNKITFWVIRKNSEITFRQGEIVNGSADMLMETTMKQIGIGNVVKCEDRSLDQLRSDLSCSRQPISEKTLLSFPPLR